MKLFCRLALLVLVVCAVSPAAQAPRVTTPKEEFGFNFGDDYQLATYQQLAAYWQKLDRESDRMVLQEIGKTSEGRPHLMAIVTSPENHKNLARIKEISRRLALAEGLTDDQARALAREGKAVVWIDGGLHASEVLGAQQLGEMVYQMVSRTDEETMRFLNDTVILFVHANPDGHDLVAGWYMRNPVPEKRSPAGLPLLYHHYIGHDNNRDFFASTQKETENINRVLYHEWSPQILYNHHQSGPAGTVFWSPPFRDPFNYNQDPLLVLGLQQLGIAIHTRMAAEGKPGAAGARGRRLRRLVERRHPQHRGVSQHPGDPDRDDRQPDADAHSARAAAAAADERSHVPDPAAGVALPPVDRVLDHRQSRRARLRVALARDRAVQRLSDGPATRSRAAAPTRGRPRRIATPRWPRRSACRRPAAAAAVAARRSPSATPP